MAQKQTPIYENCIQAGGRMVNFSGWEMPVQFSGLIKEHHAVRERVGMFDISHMGVLYLRGNNPKDALQALVPSDLNRIGAGEACYTLLLNENGGILDDLIIYDLGPSSQKEDNLLLIVNAACAKNDKKWLEKHLLPKGIQIDEGSSNKILIAIQGPQSKKILEEIGCSSLQSLPYFGHTQINIKDLSSDHAESTFIGRTGYTGEDGFELLLNTDTGRALWNRLIQKGVTPCGLGARDTLRLEAGMHLYGNELNETTTPFEAGLGWLVHLEMPNHFIGRPALEQQSEKGINRRLVGLKLKGRSIARHGYEIISNHKKIGVITSGSWSPTLNEAIALAYVPNELSQLGTSLNVLIRGKECQGTVVKRPFYRKDNKIKS